MADPVKIVGVAMRHEDGRTWTLPPPNRHCDLIKVICAELKHYPDSQITQGFVDSLGRFCRRAPALMIAQKAGQLLPRAIGHRLGKLYSEDVW